MNAQYLQTGPWPTILILPLPAGAFMPPRCLRRQEGTRTIQIASQTDVPSHEDLIARVAAHKDRAAFHALFGFFAPRLKSYLTTLGLDGEKAEDLMQETLVAVWQKAAQYDAAKARASTWIYRIARNKFIDHTRRMKYPEVDADDHLPHLAAPEKTDKPVIDGQEAGRARAALGTLKPEQRQVIELSFYEELSHSQIADRLGLPLGTVKSRIRIAFEALRRELGDRS